MEIEVAAITAEEASSIKSALNKDNELKLDTGSGLEVLSDDGKTRRHRESLELPGLRTITGGKVALPLGSTAKGPVEAGKGIKFSIDVPGTGGISCERRKVHSVGSILCITLSRVPEFSVVKDVKSVVPPASFEHSGSKY